MIVPQNPTYAYVGAFIDELARAGVRDVVICPGSRSTPLTLTFAAEERIRKWVLVDERSAAFFALGIAKRSGIPVALVCTSGTAAANFFPAICEAKASRVPLIVMTADRPPELQEVGAPQTMGQKHLYGEHVKWFTEMPLPEATDTLLRYTRFTANRAVATAGTIPMGPIHLNFPFREPLANVVLAKSPSLQLDQLGWLGRKEKDELRPYVVNRYSYYSGLGESLLEELTNTEKGLIIIGPDLDLIFRKAGVYALSIVALAQKLNYPVLIDPLSQLRFGPHNHRLMIDNYDAFLRDTTFFNQVSPGLILHLGGVPTSKILSQYLEAHPHCKRIAIDAGVGWLDPSLRISEITPGDPYSILGSIRDGIEGGLSNLRPDSQWAERWKSAKQATHTILQNEIQGFTEIFEGRVFTELSDLKLHGCNLVIGNSMPIRDSDTFLYGEKWLTYVYGNRGVNGIDGMTSTALGISSVQNEPTVLVVGDLTFYHDLNGLLAAKKYGLNLTIVVINNDGGGIFSFLPQAEHHPDHFEDYFGTPTGLDFSLVTTMYGGTFTRIENWEQFREAVTWGITEGGLHVVEVPTNRESNVAMHRHLWKKVSEALKELHSA